MLFPSLSVSAMVIFMVTEDNYNYVCAQIQANLGNYKEASTNRLNQTEHNRVNSSKENIYYIFTFVFCFTLTLDTWYISPMNFQGNKFTIQQSVGSWYKSFINIVQVNVLKNESAYSYVLALGSGIHASIYLSAHTWFCLSNIIFSQGVSFSLFFNLFFVPFPSEFLQSWIYSNSMWVKSAN